ncbi:potassium channel subfamily K member 10 [Reticulomyxa filosa]|uniref:Potassium channel subfamily K member 10 n=1 Tax=Reticulomyxa filosa TaxID=46433 RepID=X6NZX0_RETFI|nr:potassium channel subfamily K member 10 [Reticulomyxa filosa]|eukprot:ETO31860.1 potassium channel subfamily K member 10 [Reticulomyxa filosa]
MEATSSPLIDEPSITLTQSSNNSCCNLKKFRQRYPLVSKFVTWTLVLFVIAEIGGVVFSYCEYWHEKNQIKLKKQLYANITTSLNETMSEQLDLLLSLSSVPDDNSDNRWRIKRAAFFTFTTASTIGYGFTAPKTTAGRLCVFLYGLPAIVIYGLAFYNIGTVMVTLTDKRLQNKDKRQRSFRLIRERCSFEARRMLLLFLAIVVFMLIGAISLHSKEGWSIGTGMYFMWVITNVFIYLGLALVAVFIGCCQDWFKEHYLKKWQVQDNTNDPSQSQKNANGLNSDSSHAQKLDPVSGGHPIFVHRDPPDTAVIN